MNLSQINNLPPKNLRTRKKTESSRWHIVLRCLLSKSYAVHLCFQMNVLGWVQGCLFPLHSLLVMFTMMLICWSMATWALRTWKMYITSRSIVPRHRNVVSAFVHSQQQCTAAVLHSDLMVIHCSSAAIRHDMTLPHDCPKANTIPKTTNYHTGLDYFGWGTF